MSNLVRRQSAAVTSGLTIPTEPQDEEKILSILHLLQQYGGNKDYNVGTDISIIQIGDTYQLAAYPARSYTSPTTQSSANYLHAPSTYWCAQ